MSVFGSRNRFTVDALSQFRATGLGPVFADTAGGLLPIDAALGYWQAGDASTRQTAVNILVESVSVAGGPVSFAVLVSTSPTLATYIAVAASGPVTTPTRVIVAVSRASIDQALAQLGVMPDVATPGYLTVQAVVPVGSSAAWGASQSQLLG